MNDPTQPSNIVGYSTEHDVDERMAAQMVHDLCLAYPGHGWFVDIKGGVVHIKDLDLNDKWGMCIHYSQVKADANDRKRQVLRGAGELLERANLRRGRSDNERVLHVEGIPDKQMARNRL